MARTLLVTSGLALVVAYLVSGPERPRPADPVVESSVVRLPTGQEQPRLGSALLRYFSDGADNGELAAPVGSSTLAWTLRTRGRGPGIAPVTATLPFDCMGSLRILPGRKFLVC